MISTWTARDPEGEPVAVFATTGPGLKALSNVVDVEDVIALAYEGDGVFHVAADDAVVVVGDVVTLQRTGTTTTLLSWAP